MQSEQLPYTFKQLLGGNFTSHSSYGVIQLNSFSGVGIVGNGEESHNYLASVLYKELSNQHTRYIMEIYIVVTWNIDVHRTVSTIVIQYTWFGIIIIIILQH